MRVLHRVTAHLAHGLATGRLRDHGIGVHFGRLLRLIERLSFSENLRLLRSAYSSRGRGRGRFATSAHERVGVLSNGLIGNGRRLCDGRCLHLIDGWLCSGHAPAAVHESHTPTQQLSVMQALL